jgi:mono/diheme cytochrome c family protein
MILQPVWDRLARWRPRFSPRIYKATLVGLILLALAVPLVIVGLPFIEFLNGMAAQPKGKTQMAYGRIFRKELMVDRAPVPGSVPRGYRALELGTKGNTIEDAKAVGAKLTNPVPLTMENLRRGQDRYSIFCIACHGEMAEGNGPVTGPNRFPAPPSLHTDQARGYSDGTVFHVITKGLGKMPAYADKLEPQDRWRVIHYVRALQRAMNPRPGDTRPTGPQAEGDK